MALKICEVCGNMVSSEAESCPKCGFFTRLSVKQQKKAISSDGGIGVIVYNRNIGGQMTIEISSKLTGAVQKYDELNDFSERLAAVKKGRRWGFINWNGDEVIPCRYDDALDFSEGLAAVKNGGLWGFINKDGEEVIPCIYDEALDFSEGLAAVKNGGLWGFINQNGEEVIPCRYSSINLFQKA